MRWQDKAIILSIKNFSEKDVLLSVFTQTRGKQTGMTSKSNISKKGGQHLNISDIVHVTWNARLEQHLGRFSVEHITSTAPTLFQEPQKLWLLLSCCELMRYIPDAQSYESLFSDMVSFFTTLSTHNTIDSYAHFTYFEKNALAEFGFGLDLSQCCVSGTQDDLIFVSPKTGRAVSRHSAGEYAHRMLQLPQFWLPSQHAQTSWLDISNALIITEHFFKKFFMPEHNTLNQSREHVKSYCAKQVNADRRNHAASLPIIC